MYSLRIEVVGRLVEQYHVRLLQQQPAEGHAPLLPAGQLVDGRVSRRHPQLLHRDVDPMLFVSHMISMLRAARGEAEMDRTVFRRSGTGRAELAVADTCLGLGWDLSTFAGLGWVGV